MGLTIVKTSEEEYESLPYYEDHTMYLLDNGRIFVEGIEYGNYKEDEEENPDEEEKDLTVGSEIQPVYIDKDGNPQPLEYTIETSVPKDAKFSYEVVNENEDGLMSSADKVKFDEIYSEMYEIRDSVSNGKEIIAESITYKGINTNKDDTFSTLASNIKKIKSGNGDCNITEVPKDAICITNELSLISSILDYYAYEKVDIEDYNTISEIGIKSVIVYNNECHAFLTDKYSGIYNHYKLSNGSSWELVSNLPFNFDATYNDMVVHNNEIHIIGMNSSTEEKYHYKWNGSSWSKASVFDYDISYGVSVVSYNNEIHLIGAGGYNYRKKHYKWDGTSWIDLPKMPFRLANYFGGTSVVYKNKIFVFGETAYYKWDGSSWTKVSDTSVGNNPCVSVVYRDTINIFYNASRNLMHYIFNEYKYVTSGSLCKNDDIENCNLGSLVVYDNYMHLFKGYMHYILRSNPSTKSIISSNFYNYFRDLNGFVQTYGVRISAPSDYITCEGDAVVCNNEIHAMCTYYNITCYYKYDGKSWSNVGELSENIKGSSILFHNNKINVLGGNKTMRKWFRLKPNETLLEDTNNDLPVNFAYGCSVVYNNEIHILCYKEHYKWDGTSWTKISDIPVSIYLGSAVVYNNEIHIVCYNSYSSSYHYKWDGTSWSVVCSTSNTPSTNVYNSRAVVCKDKIVLLCNNKKFYTWEKGKTNWYIYTSPVVNFYKGAMVTYNNDVHAIGGNGAIEHWIINKKSEFNAYTNLRQTKIDF